MQQVQVWHQTDECIQSNESLHAHDSMLKMAILMNVKSNILGVSQQFTDNPQANKNK